MSVPLRGGVGCVREVGVRWCAWVGGWVDVVLVAVCGV
jgi:hypothetical protein